MGGMTFNDAARSPRSPPATLSQLLSIEYRDTVRELADQMRDSGALRIKPHRDQMINYPDTFKGECAFLAAACFVTLAYGARAFMSSSISVCASCVNAAQRFMHVYGAYHLTDLHLQVCSRLDLCKRCALQERERCTAACTGHAQPGHHPRNS